MAEAELQDAAAWYDERSPGLGLRFVHAVRKKSDEILEAVRCNRSGLSNIGASRQAGVGNHQKGPCDDHLEFQPGATSQRGLPSGNGGGHSRRPPRVSVEDMWHPVSGRSEPGTRARARLRSPIRR